jgi:hypothetical protein
METKTLKCDMDHECTAEVTHIDNSGFVYCESHGLRRRWDKPCRKLRPHELRKLARGETLARY